MKSCLIADADAPKYPTVQGVIKKLGFQVVIATTYSRGIDFSEASGFDVWIVGRKLENREGVDLLDNLPAKGSPDRPKIIYVTDSRNSSATTRAGNIADDVIVTEFLGGAEIAAAFKRLGLTE